MKHKYLVKASVLFVTVCSFLAFRASAQITRPTYLDFFGNDLTDFAVLSSSGGNLTWSILKNENPSPPGPNQATIFSLSWGLTSDVVPNLGDYSGDGVTDISVYRNARSPGETGIYYTLPVGPGGTFGNPRAIRWGIEFDIWGAEGDYDGDGRFDATIVRKVDGSLVWYILRSSDDTLQAFYYGRSVDDLPLPGSDYTGDGIDDPAVIRLGSNDQVTWIVGTTAGETLSFTPWGDFDTDFIVPGGDYDGDGRSDFMVWRGFGSGTNGVWYLLTSLGNISTTMYGIPGPSATRDRPLRSGDYDGDGKTDIAVYRPSDQSFYFLRSGSGSSGSQNWGVPGQNVTPIASLGTF